MNLFSNIIFDFKENSNLNNWQIVDDVVMGGRSQGNFKINEFGNGVFYGNVSLENNGGFSSLRYQFDKKDISSFSKIVLRVKGEGKKYQFRIKNKIQDYYYFVIEFETSKNWQEIELEISDMYPAFRGRRLNMNNFSSDFIEEIRFLIGNKKNQSFQLEIDKIYLK